MTGVFSVAEFRGLYLAQVLSLLGDQLARVALAVLVFDRTGSPLLTGLVYALGYLPAIVGGPLLSGLADRHPRRQLMIVTDLARAALVAAMAVTTGHLVVLCILLVAAELLSAPFAAARAALLADILTGERYLAGSAVGNLTDQTAQVLGFVLGGGLVLLIGPRWALLVDAATFAVSALVLQATVRDRPAAAVRRREQPRGAPRGVLRLLLTRRELRLLVVLALLCGFYVTPEALAAPYAAALGGGAGSVGLIMAAQPVGGALGALLLIRHASPQQRHALMVPSAVLATGALLGCGLTDDLRAVLALLVLSGLGTAYQLTANAAFVSGVPDEVRARAFGLVRSGITAVQGAAFLLAGAVAERIDPGVVVAASGGAGAAIAAVLAVRHRAGRQDGGGV